MVQDKGRSERTRILGENMDHVEKAFARFLFIQHLSFPLFNTTPASINFLCHARTEGRVGGSLPS